MQLIERLKNKIFNISSVNDFNDTALEIFYFQYNHNRIYNNFVNKLKINPLKITNIEQIPCLPIQFFKKHIIKSFKYKSSHVFHSSGTTGDSKSKHYIQDIKFYEKSILLSFEQYYGKISDYIILALMPSKETNQHSSLIYMVDFLIKNSGKKESGFYMENTKELRNILEALKKSKQQAILFGLTYKVLDFADQGNVELTDNIVLIETGGMKGTRNEMTKIDLHIELKKLFRLNRIDSEYSMVELMSQAYSKGDGVFFTPPWMKILIRDINDPLTIIGFNESGGINIIDLANIHSCCFISTEDLGRKNENESFEILGRFDNSDIRGCNLLIS